MQICSVIASQVMVENQLPVHCRQW